MKERKKLEHLFQERFENFEILPPENVWNEIKIKLEEKEDKKRVIPFWLKFSGIAATLVIGLFLLNTNFNATKPADKIITNSEDLKPSKRNNSDTDSFKNTKASVAVSDKNDASDTNLNFKKNIISNDNSVSVSDKNNKSTRTLNKNNASNESINSKNAVAENDLDNFNSGKPNVNSVSKNQKTKIRKSSIVVSSENEKKENLFYNYKNKKVIVADKLEKNKILSYKKGRGFNTKDSFTTIKSDENSSEKSFAEINSDNKANENSILNSTNKNAVAKNNSNSFNSDFDKNTAITSKEEELKLSKENKIDSTTIAVVEPNALEELLKEKEGKIVNAKEPKLNRWQLTTNVAPIYFSSTGNDGSALDSKFANNSKTYSTNYSYGIGVNYKVAKKIKLRTGVNSVSFNYDTNDLLFYQSNLASKIKNLAKNEAGRFIEIQNKNTPRDATTIIDPEYEINKFNGSLNQKLGYLEVPVEVSYTVLDKKFKIEILGGLSTLFLNQNEVYLESSGLKMDIGEATNLNDIHFSGNIGLGFKYEFLKNFEAKVEPVFKYQMNTYTTDTGDFKPYFIGVYTGLTFNF